MRLVAAFLACLVLISCSSRQIVATNESSAKLAYQARAAEFHPVNSWTLAGKLSIDNGEDGGSGKLIWVVNDLESMMNFRGALGKGSWQLESRPLFAQLKMSDGSISEASSVAQLLQDELGWAVPVESLKWWTLGIAAPGETDSLILDEAGRVITMHQDGWEISYSRYRYFGAFELPGRMDVVHDQLRLKMAVASWAVQQPSGNDE